MPINMWSFFIFFIFFLFFLYYFFWQAISLVTNFPSRGPALSHKYRKEVKVDYGDVEAETA
jgi:hypothetical protein